MKIVSYVTKKTPYVQVLEEMLLPSLKKYNLDYHIEYIDSLGNWQNNTSYKGRFMYDMLNLHKQDICFLDADAEIIRYPHLLFKIPDDCAMACHYLDWWLFWKGKKNGDKRELLSGTMIFKYNEQGLELAKKYMEATKNNDRMWEQKVLQKVIDENNFKVFELPIQYCTIKKVHGVPGYITEPIIVHNQVSRKYK